MSKLQHELYIIENKIAKAEQGGNFSAAMILKEKRNQLKKEINKAGK